MTDRPVLRTGLVDDDTVMREGLPLLLARSDIETLPFDGVEPLLLEAPALDLVLLDLDLTGTGRRGVLQGKAAVSAVAVRWPVLIYTNQRRRLVLAACLASGAGGVVHKAEPIDDLIDAMVAVAAGGVVITTALVGLAEAVARRGSMPELTVRQVEVLAGRARGEPFKSIALRLGISRKTAEEHMAGVTSRFADYLREHSPADLERLLGLGIGDLAERVVE